MTYSEVVKVRIKEDTAAALKAIAQAEGTTVSALMRQNAEAMLIPHSDIGEWN